MLTGDSVLAQPFPNVQSNSSEAVLPSGLQVVAGLTVTCTSSNFLALADARQSSRAKAQKAPLLFIALLVPVLRYLRWGRSD
jgi:hypothetical protein